MLARKYKLLLSQQLLQQLSVFIIKLEQGFFRVPASWFSLKWILLKKNFFTLGPRRRAQSYVRETPKRNRVFVQNGNDC